MGPDRDLQVKVPGLEMQVCLKVLGEGEMKGIVFETTQCPGYVPNPVRGGCLALFGQKALETEG